MEQMLIILKKLLLDLVFCLAMVQVVSFLFYMLVPKPLIKTFRLMFKCTKVILIKSKNTFIYLVSKYKKKKQPSYTSKKVVDLSKYLKAK